MDSTLAQILSAPQPAIQVAESSRPAAHFLPLWRQRSKAAHSYSRNALVLTESR